MALVDLVMPKLGESITDATILRWLKKVGDPVKMDETVLEIATDKVDSEVPSSVEGVIEVILYKENDVVPVDSVIAKIRTDGPAETHVTETHVTDTVPPEEDKTAPIEVVSSELKSRQPGSESLAKFYSPLVLNIAASEGIGLSELEKIPGTGNEGRITKKDILNYVANKKKETAASAAAPSPASHQAVVRQDTSLPAGTSRDLAEASGRVEIIEMDRMRKLIAEHMVRSKHTSPHVTSFSEADVTNMVMWRNRIKADFEKREGTRITFTPLIIEAIVKCIKKFPLINSSLDGDRIIVKKNIHIGMATALPSGNLIVPVIRNADQLNLTGLTRKVNDLADAARNGKLSPDDTQGGTFTFTNVGSFGSLTGTPIINQPQVAVMAVGIIKKRPVVIETPQGDSIAIRHMMYLSMSYDHRIVDGSLGATFVTAVAKELENFQEREF